MNMTQPTGLSTQIKVSEGALLNAIANHDFLTVKQLLEDGINCDFVDDDMYSPISCAASMGNLEIMKLLLAKDLKTTLKGYFGAFAVYEAVVSDEAEAAKLLIDVGAQPSSSDFQDSIENTSLHVAIEKENIEIVKLLLKNGALVNWADSSGGNTPLHKAVTVGNNEIVTLLLEAGAYGHRGCCVGMSGSWNGYGTTPEHATPFLVALQLKHTDIMNTLLDSGVNIDVEIDLCNEGSCTASEDDKEAMIAFKLHLAETESSQDREQSLGEVFGI